MAHGNFNGRVPPPPPPLPQLPRTTLHYPAPPPPLPPPFAPLEPPPAPTLDRLDEDEITPVRESGTNRWSNHLSDISSRPLSGASSQQPESPKGLADVDHRNRIASSLGNTRISSLSANNAHPEEARLTVPGTSPTVDIEQERNFANAQRQRSNRYNSYPRPPPPDDNSNYEAEEEEEGYNPLADSDLEPEVVVDMRKARRYNVSKASITNAAFYCISASVYLGLVFALELRFQGQLVFLPGDVWRYPFFYCCVIAWALLVFGFFISITIRALGRSRGHVLSLAPNNRWVVVGSLIWVSAGLVAAATASVFVFMGMRNRGEQIFSGRDEPFQKWVLPILAGLLSAAINAAMALSCFIAAGRASKSIKAPSSRSKSRSRSRSKSRSRSRSRDEIALPVAPDDSFGNAPQGSYESWGRIQDGRRPPPSTVPPGRGAPLPPPQVNRQLSRTEIEGMLTQLAEMGFPDERQNYEALYRSNFVLSVAAARLADAHNYR